MRLDYLRYFDHLAEVLNYTRAAEDLFIAQPTLSVAIKRMEKELGIKLFQRSDGSTRIELTEMGKAYHEYVALALKDLDKGGYRDSGYFYGPTQPRTYFVGIKITN